jgi:glucose/arabinose dehydrogenase/PKD repeat protein
MCVTLFAGHPAAALTLPASFAAVNAVPGTTFQFPTAIAFLPDGRMLVAEKRGLVWLITNGVHGVSPLWDGYHEVFNSGDCGLLDVAVDPNFYQNHYVYLLYTVDPDSDGVAENNDHAFGRLTRYTVGWSDSSQVDPVTRTVLMGATWSTGPCVGAGSHTIGSLRWGSDGTLLVSAGEGSHYTLPDAGGLDSTMFLPGRTDPSEDIGAYRAQFIGSLAGKILRLDPATGQGLPSNPYWNGDPDAPRSKVYAYGMRNPFRFTVKPGSGSTDPAAGDPGTLYIGDVGWAKWEEVDIAAQPGMNFGWPCHEGFVVDTEYVAGTPPAHNGCNSTGTPDNPAPFRDPLAVTSHYDPAGSVPPGVMGNCVVMGSFVQTASYPDGFRGAYWCDFASGTIRVLHPWATDSLGTVNDFATEADGPVDLQVDPVSGDPVYVAINTGQILRLHFTGGPNHSPVAVAEANPSAGPAPLVVLFSSAGSSDPDGDPLSAGWNFGDGATSTAPNPSHSYATPGTYVAILNVSDGRGGTDDDSVTVLVSESAPYPATPVLDDFNRPDGALGGPWYGAAPSLVVVGNRMTQTTNPVASAVWPDLFGASQEAYLRVPTVSSAAVKQAVMLKIAGADSTSPHIEVRYSAQDRQVTLNLWDPATGFQTFAGPWAVRVLAGDRFGGRVYQNGRVEAYRNSALIGAGTVAGWPWLPGLGRIGFVLAQASAARHDDFGGGTIVVSSNTPPHAVIHAPADSSFFAEGDTIHLLGAGTDTQDDSTRLVYHWDVLLHHNNHIHPVLSVDTSATQYLGENHDDGTGVWIDNRLIVTDTGGLVDTADVHLFPDIDLLPAALATTPSTPGTTAPALYRFTLRNQGRMPSPTVHWTITGEGGVLVAQGDTLVGAGDSVMVAKWAGPALAAGGHTLRLAVDTLSVFTVVETDEANNTLTRAITVVEGPGPDEFPPLFVAGPFPATGISAALVRWSNDEPTWGLVRYGSTPALGDSSALDSISTEPAAGHAVAIAPLAPGSYYFRAVATDTAGNVTLAPLDSLTTLTTGVPPDGRIPEQLALSPPAPNPTQDAATLHLDLPRAALVQFELLDLAGRVVWREAPRGLAAGRHTLAWDGVDQRGRRVAAGLYYARATVDGRRLVRRLVMLP